VENGGVEGTVDLSGAASVQDILTRVNADSNNPLNISASVMSSGKALDITSSNASTVALVFDGDNTKSSSALGIQGEKDILKTFRLLKEALEKNDGHAIQGILQHFDEGLKETLAEHAVVGASSNKLERAETIQTELQVNTAKALSETEDVDILKTLSDFSLQQTALQVSLQSAARIIQPTLLDFLR
jgi:flagellin-like hook-associated protein FlgL